ncbi:hypothetical protein [Actinomadura welshii]|uniref:hypothetical protein n=1 Tax=Actinomadura welshii TaxID=3103817 RepID=UPI0003AD2C6F|nr:hypothetical protein [Actinomadura madurae]
MQFTQTLSGVIAGGIITLGTGWILAWRQQRNDVVKELRSLERAAADSVLKAVDQIRILSDRPDRPEGFTDPDDDEFPFPLDEEYYAALAEAQAPWETTFVALIDTISKALIDLPDPVYSRMNRCICVLRASPGVGNSIEVPITESAMRNAACAEIKTAVRAARRHTSLGAESPEFLDAEGWVAQYDQWQREQDLSWRQQELKNREEMRVFREEKQHHAASSAAEESANADGSDEPADG